MRGPPDIKCGKYDETEKEIRPHRITRMDRNVEPGLRVDALSRDQG